MLGIKKKQDDQKNEELNKRLLEQEAFFQTQQKQFEETQRQMDERLKMMKNITTGGENGSKTAPLLIRASQEMENENFEEAEEYYDRVLDMDPTSSEAWIGKFWADQEMAGENEFYICSVAPTRQECQENYYENIECLKPFEEQYFKNALKYANSEEKSMLLGIKTRITNRCDTENQKIFDKIALLGTNSLKRNEFEEAHKCFEFLIENDPTDAHSHWNLFLVEQHVKSNDDFLAKIKKDNITALQNSSYVKNALKLADDDFKSELNNVFSRMEQCAAENHWKAYLNSCNKSQSGNDVVTMVKTQDVPKISHDLSDVKLAYSMADENLKEEMDQFFEDINREANSKLHQLETRIDYLKDNIKKKKDEKSEYERNVSLLNTNRKKEISTYFDYGDLIFETPAFSVCVAIIAITLSIVLMVKGVPSISLFNVESWGILLFIPMALNWILRLIVDLIIGIAIFFVSTGIVYFFVCRIRNSREQNNRQIEHLVANTRVEIKNCDKSINSMSDEVKKLQYQKEIFSVLSSMNYTNIMRDAVTNIPPKKQAHVTTSRKKVSTNIPKSEINYSAVMDDPTVLLAMENGKISCSLLERKLKIPREEARRRLEALEKLGILGPPNATTSRKVLITKEELIELCKRGNNDES